MCNDTCAWTPNKVCMHISASMYMYASICMQVYVCMHMYACICMMGWKLQPSF